MRAGATSPAERRAMTLIELAASLAIASAVISGLASAILLMSRAVPGRDDPILRAHAADELTRQVAEDLRFAMHFTERTATSAAFTVPDRNGDGSPEWIRYAWSGPGTPLTMDFNREGPVDLGGSLDAFEFSWRLEQTTETHSGPLTESSELELFGYTSTTSLTERSITSDQFIGQRFAPNLPAEAQTWKVTRARVYARDDGNNGDHTLVRLRPLDASRLPAESIIDEQVLVEASIDSSFVPREVVFDNAGGLLPSERIALTLEHGGEGPSARVRYRSGGVSVPDAAMLDWQSGGGWTSASDSALLLHVYGTYTTEAPARTVVREFITGATVVAGAGDAVGRRSIMLFNAPEDLLTFWQTEFRSDPLTLDANGDGVPDFSRGQGSTTPLGYSGGSWNVNQRLVSNPDDPLAGLVTLDVRLRDTTKSGSGGSITLCVDRSGPTAGVLRIHVIRSSDDTQTITVDADPGGSQQQRLVRISGLGTGYIGVRLLADPAANLVNVQIDGVDLGTFTFERTNSGSLGALDLRPLSSENGFQVDEVRLRLGGSAS